MSGLPAVALLGRESAIVVTENDEQKPVVAVRRVGANKSRVRKAWTGPLIVTTGVLSEQEFETLTPAEQRHVEAETRKIERQYGEKYLRRNRDGLHADLMVIL